MLHWMPHCSVTEWIWCLSVGRKLVARPKSSGNFSDITECQAVGHDTVWRNSYSSVNDLQHPLLFHLLVLCQSPFQWALFALPVLDPTEICHRSLCTSGLRRLWIADAWAGGSWILESSAPLLQRMLSSCPGTWIYLSHTRTLLFHWSCPYLPVFLSQFVPSPLYSLHSENLCLCAVMWEGC